MIMLQRAFAIPAKVSCKRVDLFLTGWRLRGSEEMVTVLVAGDGAAVLGTATSSHGATSAVVEALFRQVLNVR